MKPCPNPECGNIESVRVTSVANHYHVKCKCGTTGAWASSEEEAVRLWDSLPRRPVKHIGGYAELSDGDIYVRVGTDLAWYPPQDHHCMTSSVWFRGDEFRAALGLEVTP